MAFLIGVDEAGYGPNLGPLVIGFSTWQVPTVETDLYESLANAVSIGPNPDRLAICDSKKMGGGIGGLETAVFASLNALKRKLPGNWNDLGQLRIELRENLPRETADQLGLGWCNDDESCESDSKDPDEWNCEHIPVSLPVECNPDEATSLGTRLQNCACENGGALLDFGVTVVHPRQFNRMLEQHGNKSRLLGAATMLVARQALERESFDGQIRVICDRQGGRQRYGPLLRAAFEDHDVSIRSETPQCSSYLLVAKPGSESRTPAEFQIEFQVGGESNLPVALASMHAKYVRELAMIQWNKFWRTRIDGIHPTAGYPVDAARFRKDIRLHVSEREMPDQFFWRAK